MRVVYGRGKGVVRGRRWCCEVEEGGREKGGASSIEGGGVLRRRGRSIYREGVLMRRG